MHPVFEVEYRALIDDAEHPCHAEMVEKFAPVLESAQVQWQELGASAWEIPWPVGDARTEKWPEAENASSVTVDSNAHSQPAGFSHLPTLGHGLGYGTAWGADYNQCQGMTMAGNQCRNRVSHLDSRCYLH